MQVATNLGANLGPAYFSTPVTITTPRRANPAELARYDAADAYSHETDGDYLLIMKNGATVYRGTLADSNSGNDPYINPKIPHSLNSGTKSFNCVLQALGEKQYGSSMSLNALVKSKIPDWDSVSEPNHPNENESNITVRDLLTLQSGAHGSAELPSPYNANTVDTYHVSLHEDAPAAPGTRFIYDQLSYQAFALFFQIAAGGTYQGDGQVSAVLPESEQNPVVFLHNKLFQKLGIVNLVPDGSPPGTEGDYGWGEDLLNHDQMYGGAYFTANAWIRYGQFMLQRGTWKGERILAADAVNNCVGGALYQSNNAYVNPNFRGFGVSFWLNKPLNGTYDPIPANDPDGISSGDVLPASVAEDLNAQIAETGSAEKLWPDAPDTAFAAAGGLYQRLYVIPSEKLVVVRFGRIPDAQHPPAAVRFYDNEFLQKLLGTS